MSGFFADLLSRSRGTADVVRPRLASLFEPGGQRGSPADGVSPADEPPDAPGTPVPAGPAPIAASPAEGLALSRDPGATRPSPHGRHEHDRLSHDDRRIAADADTDVPIGARRHGGEGGDAGDEALGFAGGTRLSTRAEGGAARGRPRHGDHGGRTGPAASAAAGDAAASGAVVDGDVTSLPGAGASSPSTFRALTAPAPGRRSGVPRRSDGASGWPPEAAGANGSLVEDAAPTAALIAAARPPASLAPMPAQPLSSRRHAAATGARARADADAGEPIIEISIGRIDVRAAVERGPDRKASAAPSPVMGLAEYLQTRAAARGGTR
jgi:hypothetical protein